jgi:hypothetical protein
MILIGQPAKCFGVGEMLMFFQKSHHIARLTAAETFENTFRRRYIKRRSLFIMEWAAPNVIGSSLLERYEVTNHLLYSSGVHNALYGLLVYHKLDCKNTTFF